MQAGRGEGFLSGLSNSVSGGVPQTLGFEFPPGESCVKNSRKIWKRKFFMYKGLINLFIVAE